MRFSTAVILLISTQGATAFTTSTAFTRSVAVVSKNKQINNASQMPHVAGCDCSSCVSIKHLANCHCGACSSTALFMSEVPAEVEAMDGVDSEEEMHNSERPARASGTAKHHKKEEKGKPISELEVGSSVSATVKTTTSYGAFLDIGCSTDALLHISRLSDDFVSNVEDIVKAGDEVTVRIVSVDTEKNQVAVTMQSKEKEDENASRVAEKRSNAGRRKERPQRSGADRESQRATLSKLSEGGFDDTAFVEGEVVSVLDFGAFVRFDTTPLGSEGEVDGLVHISAISEGRANSVSEFVSVGDKVQVRVRTVDVDGGKVSLSMITKEAEEANPGPREKKGGGRRGREMFSPSDMGAANWAETMAEFDSTQPAFTNRPIVEDKRKK